MCDIDRSFLCILSGLMCVCGSFWFVSFMASENVVEVVPEVGGLLVINCGVTGCSHLVADNGALLVHVRLKHGRFLCLDVSCAKTTRSTPNK